ncbi:3-oxoacyl-[acyl-carrier-protein] reductase [compost metagenome]
MRCNAVAPSLVLTETVAKEFPVEMRKLVEDDPQRSRVGTPEEIAEAVAFLASDAARNITDHTLVADGGVSIHIPGFTAYRNAFGE